MTSGSIVVQVWDTRRPTNVECPKHQGVPSMQRVSRRHGSELRGRGGARDPAYREEVWGT